jgi:hypothetical protein
VDVRIGVIQAPREISLELADDIDREALKTSIGEALADDERVLWLTDRRGREVAVPTKRVAYVEIGTADGDRRIGFGG